MPQHKPHVPAYGWRPSLPDMHNLVYRYPAGVAVPPIVDWRTVYMPPVLDQGSLGSCTANAGKNGKAYADYFAGKPYDDFSRLFLYYKERSLEHTVSSDSGASIADIFKALRRFGTPPETDWPYDISTFADKPKAHVLADARKDKIAKYESVPQSRSLMQACIASKKVIIVGISVYDSFMTDKVAQTGVVPMPSADETLQGGHAVVAIGYDDTRHVYIMMNSWGDAWGDPAFPGTFTIPYAYLENPNLGGDYWTFDVV